MNLQEIKSRIEAGFVDVEAALKFVNEAVPALEQIPAIGAVAPEINEALEVANKVKEIIHGSFQNLTISSDVRDPLHERVSAVIVAQTPSAAIPPPEAASSEAPAASGPSGASAATALIAFLLFLFSFGAQAQTTNQVPDLLPAIGNPSFTDGLKTMEQAITSGTNWTFIGGYGHSLKGNNNLAFVDVAYDFNENVGVVVGYDALSGSGQSQFNSLKGGVTLKTTIYPLAWTGVASLARIPGQPFVGDLVATSRDGSVGNIVTTGINFNVYSFSRYVVDVGVQYELRAGEGVFNGNYGLIHAGISRSF